MNRGVVRFGGVVMRSCKIELELCRLGFTDVRSKVERFVEGCEGAW